jgi:hypothetical protein
MNNSNRIPGTRSAEPETELRNRKRPNARVHMLSCVQSLLDTVCGLHANTRVMGRCKREQSARSLGCSTSVLTLCLFLLDSAFSRLE